MSCIEDQYKRTTGRPPYNVYDMFAMVVFLAMENIHSVRMMSKALNENTVILADPGYGSRENYEMLEMKTNTM